MKSGFIFGSELKALRAHEHCPTTLNNKSVSGYIKKGYVNAPSTIYAGVQQLEPGRVLTTKAGSNPVIRQYWSLEETSIAGCKKPDTRSDADVTDHLQMLLRDSIKCRMISDVPLGAFLSGGIDSSTVVAIMQEVNNSPVKTFSIGFGEQHLNEAKDAAAIAKHLNTDHTELYINSQDALNVIPILHKIYDEPFADASQIPTYLVSKLTREHVTVALSGDGGDELFAGYERYTKATRYRHILKQPAFMQKAEARLLENLSPSTLAGMSKLLPKKYQTALSLHNKEAVLSILRDKNSLSLYQQFLGHDPSPEKSLLNTESLPSSTWSSASNIEYNDRYAAMQYLDTVDLSLIHI